MVGAMTDLATDGITRAITAPEPARPLAAWPRQWPAQMELLERQHDRLEALLAELLQRHDPTQPPWGAAEALAMTSACRRLLWSLRLHLRLEERWLDAHGCLCQGHRTAHQQALAQAISGFQACLADRAAQRHWLLGLQSWFNGHRLGPDAIAYALATASPSPRF